MRRSTSGTWSGVAIYQDPSLTTGVDIAAAGNSRTWNITGLVYLPHSSVTFSGLANANFAEMTFDVGAGQYTLDFKSPLAVSSDKSSEFAKAMTKYGGGEAYVEAEAAAQEGT